MPTKLIDILDEMNMKESDTRHRVQRKLDKLRKLVMFKMSNYKNHPDYIWPCKTLDSVKVGIVLNKEDLTFANLIWKKYNGGVKKSDDDLWFMIDSYLTHEQRSKISAIKIYRRFIIDSNLRDAKEAVDAREIKLERGW